MFTCPFKQLN